jgi:hypothetical protein
VDFCLSLQSEATPIRATIIEIVATIGGLIEIGNFPATESDNKIGTNIFAISKASFEIDFKAGQTCSFRLPQDKSSIDLIRTSFHHLPSPRRGVIHSKGPNPESGSPCACNSSRTKDTSL